MGLQLLYPVGDRGDTLSRPSSCPALIPVRLAQGYPDGMWPAAWVAWSQTSLPQRVASHQWTVAQREWVNTMQHYANTLRDTLYIEVEDTHHVGSLHCFERATCCVMAINPSQHPDMLATLIHEWGHLYFDQLDVAVSLAPTQGFIPTRYRSWWVTCQIL